MFIADNIPEGSDLPGAQAEAFLAANPDPGVRARPRDQLQRAFNGGFGLTISRDDDVSGVSLVYDYDVNPPGKVFHEIGTQRVAVPGFGLQVVLALLHVLQIDVSEWDPDPALSVFAVVAPATASEHNLVNVVGMTTWQPSDALAALRANEGSPFNPAKRVIAAEAALLPIVYAQLRGLYRGDRMLATPKGGELIRLDMGWFDPILLSLR